MCILASRCRIWSILWKIFAQINTMRFRVVWSWCGARAARRAARRPPHSSRLTGEQTMDTRATVIVSTASPSELTAIRCLTHALCMTNSDVLIL